jgi:hypothetical protein
MTDEERQILEEMSAAVRQYEHATHLARVHQAAEQKAWQEAECAEEKLKIAKRKLSDLFARMREKAP